MPKKGREVFLLRGFGVRLRVCAISTGIVVKVYWRENVHEHSGFWSTNSICPNPAQKNLPQNVGPSLRG
jgi:hypothetical protein